MGTQYSTMKVLIITSAMLALAASDSCSDCTPSFPTSPTGSPLLRALQHKGRSWLVSSAQVLRTLKPVCLDFPDSGTRSPLSSGLATGIPLLSGCALTSAQLQRTPP